MDTLANFDLVSPARRTLLDLAVRFGPRLLAAGFIVAVGILLARWLAHALHRWLAKRDLDPPLRELLIRVVSALIFVLFAMLALQNLGVELVPLFAGLGVAGVGLSLAMQGVLSNVVAGLTIIFTHPYRVGEYIAVVGEEGQVTEITLFSTLLSHYDRSIVVIPNRKIVGEILHNYGKTRQLSLVIGVAYGTDLAKALRIVGEVLGRSPRVVQDGELAPVVGVTALADSSIEISAKPWVAVTDYVAAVGELNKALVEAFQAQKIEIPLPQREVRLLNAAPVTKP
ncbi:MAG: mechanosensitive ion channel family protein [Polyangia bacterium]